MPRAPLCFACCVAALLSGCAQPAFQARELPPHYAADPVRDFSQTDFTLFASRVPQTPSIRPGDRLIVRLNTGTLGGDAEQAWRVTVDGTGRVSLPGIGPVQLSGLSTAGAQQSIVTASLQREVFLTPTVDVTLEPRVTGRIIVSGAVAAPGPVETQQDHVSLADVLVMAGGLTAESTGHVTISAIAVPAAAEPVPLPPVVQTSSSDGPGRQPTFGGSGPRSARRASVKHAEAEGTAIRTAADVRESFATTGYTLNLNTISPAELSEIRVPAGSFVSVEKSQPRTVLVIGVIQNTVIEIPPGRDFRLLDALARAGGTSYSNWVSDTVHVIRRDPDGNGTIRIRASIRDAKDDDRENILLAADDIVSVEENPMTFTLSTLGGLFGVGNNATRLATGTP